MSPEMCRLEATTHPGTSARVYALVTPPHTKNTLSRPNIDARVGLAGVAKRDDLLADRLARLVFNSAEVMDRLEVEPHLRRGVEPARDPQGGVGGDATTPSESPPRRGHRGDDAACDGCPGTEARAYRNLDPRR